eukprot:5469505-Prymnesium_polylepis.1
MIKAFAGLDDTAPRQKLPIGLTGYQRAMAHQYCEELGVSSRSEGSDPNRYIVMYKKDDANESAATKFKQQLGELLREKNTLPEQARVGVRRRRGAAGCGGVRRGA